MKLDVDVNEVVLSNVGATGEFRIKNSARAFSILSSGLYSNKIRAVIRELSCNAVDSHVAAGKRDVQFEVHLPTVLEPWFAVRDFGTGLDGDQVVNIYTTYFESTKTDSNEFIGALGLGSKSPFSYTENFTVTAVKNGMKRIYSAYISEMGIPCVAEMQEELTDDPNGVEVKFSVTDKYDYQSFKHEAQQVFKWFKLKPIITGVDHFTLENIVFKDENIVPGVSTMHGNRGESIAIMGNISYPLNKLSEPQKHFGQLANLLNCGLIMEFGIGELDFAASREELSYVPLTIASIKKKLEALNSQLAIHLTVRADAIECEWARADFLREEARTTLFKEAVAKYVTDTKFALYDSTEYLGKKTFKWTHAELKKTANMDILGFRVRGNTATRNSKERDYDSATHQYSETVSIPVENDIVIVLNDLKTGCYARARYHFMTQPKPGGKHTVQIFCINVDDADPISRQKTYDKFLKELHNPPIVFKASELEKEVRVKNPKTIGTQGLMQLVKRAEYTRNAGDYTWTSVVAEPDPKATHYYCCLDNWDPKQQDGLLSFDAAGLKRKLDQCGIPALNNIALIGVRKGRIKEIQKLKNWVWVEDKVRAEISKITTAHVEAIVAAEVFDNPHTRVYTNWDAAKMVGKNSDYAKFLEKYSKPANNGDTSVSSLVALCDKFGKVFVVDSIKQQLLIERNALYIKYPMLKHLMHSHINGLELAQYITLVDNQEKN